MGTAESTAELTLADIENQLTEEERCKVCHGQLAPRFSRGLSPEAVVSISDRHRFTVEGQWGSASLLVVSLKNSQ